MIPFLVFTEHLPPTASEIPIESFFASLDKSALLHHRSLISAFTEMLMLVCRKIFSALHESFSNNYGFAFFQELNTRSTLG